MNAANPSGWRSGSLIRMLCGLAGMALCTAVNAAIVHFDFTSGTDKSATATDGLFKVTISADGGQFFAYPPSYLMSYGGSSGDTLTLHFSHGIDSLSFDVGSLDQANDESVVFSMTPTVSAATAAAWYIGGLATLNGNSLGHGGLAGASARVSFTGLGGLTSFTIAEVFAGHAIYFDNFTAATAPTSVPAPATLTLVGFALASLAIARRHPSDSRRLLS